MNPSKRFQRESQTPTFCTEIGEYVFCDKDCLKCENFKESTKGEYGKNYP